MRIDRVKFAAAMAKADLTGEKLSKKTGLSRQTVSAIKNGKSCSVETARRVADVLGNDILSEVD